MISGNTLMATYENVDGNSLLRMYELSGSEFVMTASEPATSFTAVQTLPSMYFVRNTSELAVLTKGRSLSEQRGARFETRSRNLKLSRPVKTDGNSSSFMIDIRSFPYDFDFTRNQVAVLDSNSTGQPYYGLVFRINQTDIDTTVDGVLSDETVKTSIPNAGTQPPIGKSNLTDGRNAVRFSPDGKSIAWLSINGTSNAGLYISNFDDPSGLWPADSVYIKFGRDSASYFATTSGQNIVRWSPDSRRIAVGGTGTTNRITVYRNIGDTWQEIGMFPEMGREVVSIMASPDNLWWAVVINGSAGSYDTYMLKRRGDVFQIDTIFENFGGVSSFNADGSYIFDAGSLSAYELENGTTWVQNTSIMTNVVAGAKLMVVSDHIPHPPIIGYIYDKLMSKIIIDKSPFDNLNLILLKNTAPVFDHTNTKLEQAVGSGEAWGGGWPTGGNRIANSKFIELNADSVSLVGDDIKQNIAGEDLSFRSAIVYDASSTDKTPLLYYDFGRDIAVESGASITISFSTNGFLVFTP